jgi:predicted outer membrane repeat protein
MKKILLALSVLLYSFNVSATIVWVSNTYDSGPGSLRQAMQVSVQNGDTIRFIPTLLIGGSDTITVLSAIFTNKDVVIKGLYNATDTLFLSGGGTSQIFYIDHNNNPGLTKSIELDSVVMIDGSATRGGHMFFVGDYVTIKNSIFRNGKKGTGIILEGGSICLYHSYSTPSVLVIENSKFYNNKSKNGGALFTKSFKDVTINTTEFYNNEATNQGGGAVTVLSQSNVTINNSSFHHNTTTGNGGGLYCTKLAYGGSVVNLNVTGSSFYNNIANKGGAFMVLESKPTVNLKTSTISHNYSTLDGGGINISTSSNNSPTNFTIENSTISKNTTASGTYGSGIVINNSVYQSNEFLTVKGSIIADNGLASSTMAQKNIYFSGVWNNVGSGFTSNGHNLFGDASYRYTTLSSTDIVSVTGLQLNLGVIQNNGGLTSTILPGIGSIALNKGDTLDVTPAQNGAITDGYRDVGAAEYYCIIQRSISPVACASYTSPSGNYTWSASGIYADTLSVGGCDSIFTINLSINNSYSALNEITCDSYTSPSGKVWTMSNTYLDTIANNAGCDSLMTITLVIKTNTTSTISPNVCGSYTSPSGKVWTISNTYNDTISNAISCDSVIIINLSVNQSSTSSISQVACVSYSSPSGKIWIASNTYLDTIPNNAGCDSLMTIILTINQTASSFIVNNCGSYTSPSGKTITASGLVLDTITNTAGCDSVMSITLTVVNNSIGVTRVGITLTAIQTAATYKWLNCSNSFTPINGEISRAYTPSANGNYAVEITKNSCVDTSNCYVIASVGINEATVNNSLVVYPNPTSSILYIDTKGERIVGLKVFSVSGQLIDSRLKGNNTIDVSHYKSGLYILQVEMKNGITLSRFIRK